MQAISGAGYPGVSSIQIIDNVIPFISGEEEKIQTELLKILGTWTEDSEESGWIAPDIVVSASCNRVNVIDGHTLNISVELASDLKPSIEELEKLYGTFFHIELL
jgi:aspartate-semialdehyde dehydrogenase